MGSQSDIETPTKRPIRGAVIAAMVVVAACFTAAFTFADGPATAEETTAR